MDKKAISKDRRVYLRKQKMNKVAILTVQILLVVGFIALWEILANLGIIDSFIASQPSRILKTFMNLSNNDLLTHLGVTCFETIVGFGLGAVLGVFIAIILWWSNFLSKVADPFLVVLNSLNTRSLAVSTLVFNVLIEIGVFSNSLTILAIASVASLNSTKYFLGITGNL